MTPEEFESYLDDVADRLETASLAEGLDAAAQAIQAGEQGIFAAAVDSQGASWPAHAPSTVARYGPHPLLVLSGKMKAAATGGPGSIKQIGDRDAVVGVDPQAIPYARTHQHGRAPIPQRQFVHASDETLDACAEAIADAAEKEIFGEPD